MNSERQRELENLPLESSRSKLEPYREVILRWRRQGRSYRKIRQLLVSHCSLQVGLMTLHEFIQRRSRPRQADVSEAQESKLKPTLAVGNSNVSGDPYADMRERMRRHKEAPLPAKPPKLFEYTEDDATEPLVLRPSNPKENN